MQYPFYKPNDVYGYDVPLEDQIVRFNSGTQASMADNLPMDEASRMARARDMGFDVDAYHGTTEDFNEFDPALFGSNTQDRDAKLGVFMTEQPEATDYFAGFNPEMPTDETLERMKRFNESSAEEVNKTASLLEDFSNGKIDAGEYVNQVEAIRSEYKQQRLASGSDKWDMQPGYEEGGNIMPLKVAGQLKDVPVNGIYDPEKFAIWAREARDEGYDGVRYIGVQDIDEAPIRHNQILSFNPNNIRSRFAKFDPRNANSANILAGGAAGALGLGLLSNDEY